MNNILLQKMTLYFSWKKSRLECFISIIISLITNCSVSHKSLALGIDNKSKYQSKIQRIYRFFKDQIFDYTAIATFIVSLFSWNSYVIALDRTNWKFGTKDINILVLTIVIGKISIPVYWEMLDHGGACDFQLMKKILERFIDNFGVNKIKYLLADREFMNKKWLYFLNQQKINFAIPLKKDVKIYLKNNLCKYKVDKSFNKLQQNEYTTTDAMLWGWKIKLAAYRNEKGELMVVAANNIIDVDIFSLYRYRWSIERLFKHLKTSGFNIEKSHVTDSLRFMKLFAACAIAASLVVKNGLIENNINPIKFRKSHDIQKQLVSFFTYGLDILKHLVIKGRKMLIRVIEKIINYEIIDNFKRYFNQISYNITHL
jgi:hypothetical protein